MRRLVAPQVPAPSSAQIGRRCAWVCVKTALLILVLGLAGCNEWEVEKQLFEYDQMDELRQFHRDCLKRGKNINLRELSYGIQVVCYKF